MIRNIEANLIMDESFHGVFLAGTNYSAVDLNVIRLRPAGFCGRSALFPIAAIALTRGDDLFSASSSVGR